MGMCSDMTVEQRQQSDTDDGLVTTDSHESTDRTNTVLSDVTDTLHPSEQDSSIRWTRHAMERYYNRTPSNAVTHDRAWKNGIDAQYATPYFTDTTNNRFPQEVRLYDHGPCTSVIVVHDNQVRTVLLVGLIADSAIKNYLHTLTNLHHNGSLINNTELRGESPTRVEQINIRENST